MKQKKPTVRETSKGSSLTSKKEKGPASLRFFDTFAGRLTGEVIEETAMTLLLRYPAAVIERAVIEDQGAKAIQRVSFNHLSMVDGQLYRLYKSSVRGEFLSESTAVLDAYARYVAAYVGGAFAVNPYDRVEVLVAQGDATAEPVSADTKVIPIQRDVKGDAPPPLEVVHNPHSGPVATPVSETADGASPA